MTPLTGLSPGKVFLVGIPVDLHFLHVMKRRPEKGVVHPRQLSAIMYFINAKKKNNNKNYKKFQ